MFVKPAKGLIVRDPVSMQPLPPDGREVPEITHWFQRMRDGDVELVEASPPAEAEEKHEVEPFAAKE